MKYFTIEWLIFIKMNRYVYMNRPYILFGAIFKTLVINDLTVKPVRHIKIK